jgi:hypothetical protein
LDEDAFMPVIPLRYWNVDYTAGALRDAPLYITSKKLLNKIKIKIDDLADALNANPNIGEIDHAYLMFGINVQATTDLGIRYLVKFFDHLYDISHSQQTYTTTMLAGNLPEVNQYHFNSITPPVSGVIELDEHGLDINITYDFITSGFTNEVIGAVDKGVR